MKVPSAPHIPDQKYEVTPLELFFDLVYVFAVSQLSHHLLTHLSRRGAAETLVMLVAIFAVWFSTSWSATMIRADRSRTRWLVLAVMPPGLFMNASVTRAFTTSVVDRHDTPVDRGRSREPGSPSAVVGAGRRD